MSIQLANGSVISIASAYGTPINATIVTNALPAVVTATAHTFVLGDIVEVSSGWSKLDQRVIRVGAVTTNTFELEGFDSTLTGTYPVGAGIGSVRKVATWTVISQILSFASSGGDQQFVPVQFLEADKQFEIPTIKNSARLDIGLGDDVTQLGYLAVAAANDDRLIRALRFVLPNSSKLFYNAFVTLNRIPTMNVNQVMEVKMNAALRADPTRYLT